MTLARGALIVSALAFASFGLIFLIAPAPLLSDLGILFGGLGATTEVRAMYGGLELGLAAFLGVCARRPDDVPLGLLCAALLFTGLAGGRLLGLALEGAWSTLHPRLLLVEGGAAVAALALWRRARQG